ncbi:Eae-like protein, partial [Salmonella enterica subsp. enterica serovar Kottbus]|nr:Eae-like protein [Salmonella enterica subsp. enterica serovar Kottbus]
MGSNIIELAKLGHERAAELKASCGAVDVRSLAQLISDLATQLEVQFVRSTNMAVQLANAESKHRELAAENAGLKRVPASDSETMLLALDAFATHGCARPDVGLQQAINVVMQRRQTPATDAFLAEVRAQAHKEGAHFVANRMLAAWDAGFIDDTAKNAADIARMILTSTEFMADAPEGDFDRSFADGVLEDIAAQL